MNQEAERHWQAWLTRYYRFKELGYWESPRQSLLQSIWAHLIPLRLYVIWWALLGRPIIYGVHFIGGIEIGEETPKHLLIARNKV
ncbi:unnamed protein product [marine sediment metagenome]|uniref:Uncharacterized protein n=1 Tax=marine sediment metagenome TaxID=412755 RepID=X0RW87_9ZZZZ